MPSACASAIWDMPRSDRSLRNFTPINVFAITRLSNADSLEKFAKFAKYTAIVRNHSPF